MNNDIDRLKRENPIEDVISELTKWDLYGQGKYRSPKRGTEGDSLQINVDLQTYYWNSKNHGGDVIDFLKFYKNMSFKEALIFLARRANIPFHMTEAQEKAYKAARVRETIYSVAADVYSGILSASPAALAWAKGRGFTEETIKAAKCGFWDGNRAPLLSQFDLHGLNSKSDLARGLVNIPKGMFIYAHYEQGRPVYFSARSIEGKRHYNLPKDLAGEKQPYFNHVYHSKAAHVVIVEGQADALTIGQWGLAAIALAGANISRDLVERLKQDHGAIYVALDDDATGRGSAIKIAELLGATCKIVTWPAHDANDWLQNGGNSNTCRQLMATAPIFAIWIADNLKKADPLDYHQARRTAIKVISKLPKSVYTGKRNHLRALLNESALREDDQLTLSALDGLVKENKASRDKNPKKTVKVMPGGYIDDHLFEMFLDETDPLEPVSLFAVRDPEGKITIKPRLELEKYDIAPPPADHPLIAQKALLLSPPPVPYDSEADLVNRLKEFIHKYVDLTDQFEAISAYYALLTWVYDVFEKVPYLRRVGDFGGGKSRFLQIMRALCYRSFMIIGATTISPIFRVLDQFGGTLLVDEADIANGNTERAADMLSIFNAGYSRDTGKIARSVKDGQGDYVERVFSVYGPKLFAARRPFPDEATNSRCLSDYVSAGGYFRDDIPVMLNLKEFWQEASQIRSHLLQYRLVNWRPTVDLTVESNHSNLPGRLREITLPMRVLFDDDSLKKDIDELINASNAEVISSRMQTISAKILEGIIRAWYAPQPEAEELAGHLRLALKFIAHRTNLIIDSENAEASSQGADDKEGDQAQKPKSRRRSLTPQSIGKYVRKDLNLRTETDKKERLVYVIWDEKRIEALSRRFGLEDLLNELIDAWKETEQEKAAKEVFGS